MKPLLLILVLLSTYPSFSQDSKLRTYDGLSIDTNTCVFNIRMVDISTIDSFNNKARKLKIERLIYYLKACKGGYQFSESFEDKEIIIQVPSYIKRVTYELGNQKFAIVLRDSSAFDRCIVFSYDFDDSYKKYFLTNDNKGFKKTE